MNSTHRIAGLALAGVVLLGACGSSSEDSLEQIIENETGEDVEIDIDDDGGFSLESEDGSFSIDEEGNFTVVGEDGEVITGDVDASGDEIVVQSEDGDVVIQGDGESGSIEISGEDGDVSFATSDEIPDEWPAEVPQPTGLTVYAGSVFDDGTNSGVTVTGGTSVSPVEYVESYGPMLEAAGYAQTTYLENDGNVTAFYEGGGWSISVSGAVGDGESNINVGVTPANP